jgi:hypothetical protein
VRLVRRSNPDPSILIIPTALKCKRVCSHEPAKDSTWGTRNRCLIHMFSPTSTIEQGKHQFKLKLPSAYRRHAEHPRRTAVASSFFLSLLGSTSAESKWARPNWTGLCACPHEKISGRRCPHKKKSGRYRQDALTRRASSIHSSGPIRQGNKWAASFSKVTRAQGEKIRGLAANKCKFNQPEF